MRTGLHPKQREVLDHSARFKVVTAGRRWGKTALARSVCIRKASGGKKRRIWYVAPTYKMAKQIFWQELLDNIPRSWIKKINHTEMSVLLKNGSLIECKGADKPDSLRGVGLYFVVLDEFQDMKLDVWTKVIRPTLAKDRGDALIIGTPKGYANLYDVHKLGQDPNNRQWKSWQFPTITSPFIPVEEIEAAKNDMDPKSFRQEFEACHLPETEVIDIFGNRKQIQKLEKGDLLPFIMNNGERSCCSVIQVGETGIKPITEVVLETGEVITASNHHKFKVHEDELTGSIFRRRDVA